MCNNEIEEYLISNLSVYIGEKDKYIKKIFGIENSSNKSTWVELAYKMADVSSNKKQELLDNNIVIKTIRINKNGKIKENMSFPTIQFKELVRENWNESYIHCYFRNTKFLFIVYKESDFEYIFLGGTFWSMSEDDLEHIVKQEWENIQAKVLEGIKFSVKNGVVSNNLPKKSQTKIIHLRPKANKAAYKLNGGFSCGNIKIDGDELPNGEWMTRQCFWLNNDYVLGQIEKKSLQVKCSVNSLGLVETKYQLLRTHLTKDFYIIEEFKSVFMNVLNIEDEKYFNAYNIDKVGYRFNFSYVYSKKYESIQQYIKTVIMNGEIVDLTALEPGLIEVNKYTGLVDGVVKTLPVFRIQNNVFINKAKLIRGGFTDNKIDKFSADVKKVNVENYFTVKSLRNDMRFETQFEDGFEDCFYEDILLSSDYFSSFKCGDKKVFCTINGANEFAKFLRYILRAEKKLGLIELNDLLKSQYGINYNFQGLQRLLRFSELYYNQDIEKIYIDYNEFIQEIKGYD